MSTIACQFSCRRGFANKGQDVSRASVTGIVRSVHYTGWQLQNGQLSTALGSCVYSRAADPFIQLWFTMLAKARERIICKNLALTSCTPASQKKLSSSSHRVTWLTTGRLVRSAPSGPGRSATGGISHTDRSHNHLKETFEIILCIKKIKSTIEGHNNSFVV